MKIVVSGSYGDLESIYDAIKALEESGDEVIYPTPAHIVASRVCIEADHGGRGDTEVTVKQRAKMMNNFFNKIKECDALYMKNLKHEVEHIGLGAAMEIGFAYALGKIILFHEEPTDASTKSMKFLIFNPMEVVR